MQGSRGIIIKRSRENMSVVVVLKFEEIRRKFKRKRMKNIQRIQQERIVNDAITDFAMSLLGPIYKGTSKKEGQGFEYQMQTLKDDSHFLKKIEEGVCDG